MKRIISLFSCLVIVAACFVVPVSAASDIEDGKLLNLLDYGNALESNNNYMRFENFTVLNYQTPYYGQISYVDIVFKFWSTQNAKVNLVYLMRGNSEIGSLKFYNIHGQYYRAFGTVTSRAYGGNTTIGLKFQASNNLQFSYVSIESFLVGAFSSTDREISANVDLVLTGQQSRRFQHTASSHATHDWEVSGDIDDSGFLIELSSYDNWQLYDYIDYFIGLTVADITSINVTSKGYPVPFEVCYLQGTGLPGSSFYVTIRVDCTNLDRSAAAYVPTVSIAGNSHYAEFNAFTVGSVVGHMKYETENPVIYWFKKTYFSMTDGFQSVVNAITGSNSDMDQTGQDMKDAADDLNGQAAAFDQIETPDIDVEGLTQQFVNFSPSGLTVLATITTNPYVSGLLVLVFTFALCAYVLFGKR